MFSVITPTYNSEEFIEETLLSLLKNKEKVDLQHIVVDAGSTDRTKEIVLSYGISEFYELINSSMYEAIDYGFSKSIGDILCWLNSDDMFYGETLEFVERFFRNNKSVDILLGDHVFIDMESKDLYPYNNYFCASKIAEYFPVLMLCQPSTFWRREVYFSVGGFNLDYSVVSDRDYFIRIVRKFNAKHVNKKLSKFRVHSNNKSKVMNHLAIDENILIDSQLGSGPTNFKRKIYSFIGMNLIKILNYQMWIWKFKKFISDEIYN